MKTDELKSEHHKNTIIVCPKYEEQIWNKHPRIYLNLTTKEKITCPYCGSEFKSHS